MSIAPTVAPLAVDDAYTVKSARKVTFSNKLGVLANDTDGNGDWIAKGGVAVVLAHDRGDDLGQFSEKPRPGLQPA